MNKNRFKPKKQKPVTKPLDYAIRVPEQRVWNSCRMDKPYGKTILMSL